MKWSVCLRISAVVEIIDSEVIHSQFQWGPYWQCYSPSLRNFQWQPGTVSDEISPTGILRTFTILLLQASKIYLS